MPSTDNANDAPHEATLSRNSALGYCSLSCASRICFLKFQYVSNNQMSSTFLFECLAIRQDAEGLGRGATLELQEYMCSGPLALQEARDHARLDVLCGSPILEIRRVCDTGQGFLRKKMTARWNRWRTVAQMKAEAKSCRTHLVWSRDCKEIFS